MESHRPYLWLFFIGLIFLIIGIILLRWIQKKSDWYNLTLIILGSFLMLMAIIWFIMLEVFNVGKDVVKVGAKGAEDVAPLAPLLLL